ncbi:MinD/ParA family protein [Dechloromonas agitata]|uniref:MinD/ParA family ATP-binding protein n=1 Tax=Dechloromonas agitata TaxID=73030 RepID=UPI000485FE05|nr:MinD/ParA family protein [Dechloromonas agitata]MDE1547177.1 MinD/ParA family protein [Dechloromonas agitata]
MADFRVDQAAGLRRLLGGGQQLQVVTFVAGCEGVGRSVAVANIGVAMARLGKEVLIIDEHPPGDDIATTFGLVARGDLLNVVQRETALSLVLLQPMRGLRVLPAARAVKKLGRLSLHQQQTLLDAMSGLDRPVDVILVDASTAHPHGFSPFGLAAQEAVVVLSGSSASITEAYALIKKVSHAFARKHFRILVNKVRSQPDARSIYENIAQVAAQRGIARLDYAGAVPLDESLRQAVQLGRPVLLQAPDSPSAAAFRDIASDMLYWQRSDSEAAGVEQFMQQLLHLSQRITPHALRA